MNVIIAGGGTGGHVYPALAIAKAIKIIKPEAEVHFVGTPMGIEAKVIPKENFKLHFVPISRLNTNVSLKERLLTLLRLPLAFIKSAYLLLKLKPIVVLGVGGYASGPVVFIAALLRYRTFIWEPNAYPGLANRILSRFVTASLIVFPETKKHLRGKSFIQVHVPVRPEIENLKTRVPKMADFCVLVFGGSQGARFINNVVCDLILSGDKNLNDIRFVHQVGNFDFEKIKARYESQPEVLKRVEYLEYLHDMPERYLWADLVVARSGIGTLAELAAIGKAAILVPLPTAADDHQKKNAQALVDKNAALMIEQSKLTKDSLLAEIIKLKNNPDTIHQLEKRIKEFHSPDAATRIASLLLK
jgi:UDP-N-acetylglucosamine--N-acetylmuramyl-(pentapeptide) pyrophosphoryl-undecaprenol N-acetylglucosamine transferase